METQVLRRKINGGRLLLWKYPVAAAQTPKRCAEWRRSHGAGHPALPSSLHSERQESTDSSPHLSFFNIRNETEHKQPRLGDTLNPRQWVFLKEIKPIPGLRLVAFLNGYTRCSEFGILESLLSFYTEIGPGTPECKGRSTYLTMLIPSLSEETPISSCLQVCLAQPNTQ